MMKDRIGIPPSRDCRDPGWENLLLRVREKFRTREKRWETLLQWVHAKVDITWKEAYMEHDLGTYYWTLHLLANGKQGEVDG